MPQYDIGNTIYIARGTIPFIYSDAPFTNALIVGREWGGDNRKIARNVWTYYVRDVAKSPGSPMFQIAEDQISGRISM